MLRNLMMNESTSADFADDVLSDTEASTVDVYHTIDDCDDATSTFTTIDAEHKVNDYHDDTPHTATAVLQRT
jgi:hypothetical protein